MPEEISTQDRSNKYNWIGFGGFVICLVVIVGCVLSLYKGFDSSKIDLSVFKEVDDQITNVVIPASRTEPVAKSPMQTMCDLFASTHKIKTTVKDGSCYGPKDNEIPVESWYERYMSNPGM